MKQKLFLINNIFQMCIWFILVVIFIGCKTNSSIKNENLQSAFESYLNSDEEVFQIPNGVYELTAPLYKGTHNKNVTIKGSGKTILKLLGVPLINVGPPPKRDINYSKAIDRGERRLTINSRGVKIGDIVEIRSSELGELSWKYKKTEVCIVTKISGNYIEVEDGFNFSYRADEDVKLTIRTPINVRIYDLNIETAYVKSRGKAFILQGCEVNMDNVNSVGKSAPKKDDFLSCYSCINSEFSNITLKDFRYGLLINNSRNIKVNTVHADDTNHAVAPSTWSTNVVVDGYTGKNTVTDAHMGFDITYKNVDIDCGEYFFNNRALGITMENCKFVSHNKNPKSKVYIGVIALAKEQEYLRNEYDITFRNVEWVHNIHGSNGITISKCRNLVIDSCRTHYVSTKGVCTSVEVSNSTIGAFKCYDSNFEIYNTVFDGNLIPENGPDGAIFCSYSGQAIIDNCKFNNYRNKYLFQYIHGQKTDLKFMKCDFTKFRGLAKKIGYPEKKYTGLTFDKCTFSESNFLSDSRFSVLRR